MSNTVLHDSSPILTLTIFPPFYAYFTNLGGDSNVNVSFKSHHFTDSYYQQLDHWGDSCIDAVTVQRNFSDDIH